MRRTSPPARPPSSGKSQRPAARIASERARTARSAPRDRAGPRTPARGRGASRAAPPPARSGHATPGIAARLRRNLRLIGWMVAMALVGFIAVRAVDVVQRAVGSAQLREYSAADLWQKLVDRLLDRDVPRTGDPRGAPGQGTGGAAGTGNPKSTPGAARAPAPSASGRRSSSPAAASQSPAAPAGARAELPASSPEAYARQSRTLGESRGAAGPAPRSRERIDAILRKVGAEPGR